MAIVKLTKTKDQKVNEFLEMFKLPYVNSKGYQVKPSEPVVGGSAINIRRRSKDSTQ